MTITSASLSEYMWTGLAGDTKPTDNTRVGQNDVFLETDTGKYYIANILAGVVTWVVSTAKPPMRSIL